MNENILEIKNLNVYFREKNNNIKIIDNVSFSIKEGECLGILGESGSGKSMTIKSILRLLDNNFHVEGKAFFNDIDLIKESAGNIRKLRGNDICMILQNPMTCFDPLYRIYNQMEETFAEHTNLNKEEIYKKCIDTLNIMKIRNPEDTIKKYPHQLSGGMLQRIMIGLALSLNPKLLIADEPTTAIDSISQNAIMNEFIRIKKENKVSMLFISHDLGILSKISDKMIVMKKGKILENASVADIIFNSKDDYTNSLVSKRMSVMKKFNEIVYGDKIS
ncbi:dipeptide/oligopeptide/nickel ABC transporter ATPase [Brachyspira hampsonii 30446]|uniref:Dipeptide/oligopeptide/nickel ABC transporter ATPase n=1 Tax=Brachyspira hampsonii 30446 TaxID=1289135 RepID=A0A2U4FMK4_9SPIR|nr:ABC transporter ATP-binding protein [Brachyspira hampsonii]EKV56363.1 dipeptide/oligopeptide/nickel ABC transporter ATPase [Brachyspira hampsonii 30446]MBW5393668.1 ABC transporter ATP-binding protein [Brachyspira hampsonii]OEJ13127.1 nickel import ATP-binding protein NikD [Brachyspira hampsonii]